MTTAVALAVPRYGRKLGGLYERVVHKVVDARQGRGLLAGQWTTAQWACLDGASFRGTQDPTFELFEELSDPTRLCQKCFREPALGVRVVYLARTKSGAIKIGTTADLRSRVRALDVELLAWQLGGRDIERTLHRVFADLRIPTLGEECFVPGPALLAYIDRISDGMDEAAA